MNTTFAFLNLDIKFDSKLPEPIIFNEKSGILAETQEDNKLCIFNYWFFFRRSACCTNVCSRFISCCHGNGR